MQKSSIHAAAEVLTEIALRPDLAAALTGDELQIRAEYDQLRAIEARRAALRFELESCRRAATELEQGLVQRIRSARFSLRRQSLRSLPTGHAA